MTKKEIKKYAKEHKCSIREAQRKLGVDATGNFANLEEHMTKKLSEKFCSLKQLGELNQISMDKGYNRNLYFENFAKDFEEKMKEEDLWNGEDDTYVLLIPLMFHNHKQMEPCETHIRTQVFTDGLVGSFLTLDIPIREFMALGDCKAVKDYLEVA